MFVVVVVFFGVACSALPISEDGEKCLYECYFSVLRHGPLTNLCEVLSSLTTCWKQCPNSRLTAVVHQLTRLSQKQCSPSVSEEQREKFMASYGDLFGRLIRRASRCEGPAPEDDEALCKNVASCVLGSALDELKADYPKDVVTAIADSTKLWSVQSLKNHTSPPEACSFLFEPYKA